jgi:hypothetical protein
MNANNSSQIWNHQVEEQTKEIFQMIIILQKNPPNRAELENQLMMKRNNLQQVLGLCRLLEKYYPDNSQLTTVLFSVVELKNILKIHYEKWIEAQMNQIYFLLVEIKKKILELFFKIPIKSVGNCLLECINLFLNSDYYPECWPEFFPIIQMLYQNRTINTSHKTLTILESLTKKYPGGMKNKLMMKESDHVIVEINNFLLQELQVNMEDAVSGSANSSVALKNIVLIMKIFFNCIYHQVHETVVNSIPNWMKFIKTLLSTEMESKILQIISNAQKSKKTLFNLKGECIRVILLINRKHKQDFDDYLTTFTEEIWRNCQQNSKNVGSKMITFSIRYFKNFVITEKYQSFFRSKLRDIMIQMVIPHYLFSKSELEVFEFEPDSFAEILFVRILKSVKSEREEIQKFVACLGKFHWDHLYPILTQFFQELVITDTSQLNEEFIFRRIAFLNILINASAFKCNLRNGIISSFCPQQLIVEAFQKIILPLAKFLLDNLQSNPSIKLFFILCHLIRFADLFKYYLPFDQVCQLYSYFLQKTINLDHEQEGVNTFYKCLFLFGSHLLKMKMFKFEDKTQIDNSHLPFRQRYYVCPKVLIIHIDAQSKMVSSQNPLMTGNIEYLYKFFSQEKSTLNEQGMQLFEDSISFLENKVLEILDPLVQIYSTFVSKIQNNQIHLNFGLINKIFESLSALIIISSSQISTFPKILPLIKNAMQLFIKNEPELNSVLIQVLIIFIKNFKVNVQPIPNSQLSPFIAPNEACTELFKESSLFEVISYCLEVNNYKGDFIILSKLYLHLIIQCAFLCPDVIEVNWDRISNILQFLMSKEMHLSIIFFFNNLFISKIFSPKVMEFFCQYLSHMLSFPQTTEHLITLQIFFRETTFLLLTFVEVNGIQILFKLFENSNVLQLFFSHNNFSQFISTFGGFFQRKYMIIMFAKLLFENSQIVINVLSLPVYQNILNSILNNICLKRRNFGVMRHAKKDDKLYIENINNNTENTFKKIYKFKRFFSPDKVNFNKFIRSCNTHTVIAKTFFIEKLKAFMSSSNIDPSQLLSSEHVSNINL